MKKYLLAVILVFALIPFAAANELKEFPTCKYCGMDRDKFGHSRVYIEYDQGKPEAFCSVHCAAVDLAVNIDRTPKRIMVGDFKSKELLDVETAAWVIGGNKTGVMTKRAKWAFKTNDAAELFIKEHGGVRGTFDTVIAATYEDMYLDSKMIRERRAMKRKAAEEKKTAEMTKQK